MTSDAIVSFAQHGREPYPLGLPRVVRSAREAGFHGDFILSSPDYGSDASWNGERNSVIPSMPAHWDIPYGFKPEIVRAARDRGYKRVLWCDATVFFVHSISDVFDEISKHGVLVFDNPGCPESTWTSDDCLSAIGCPVETARTFVQVMACVLGFDFTNPKACTLFDDWYSFSKDYVSFRGVSGSHRADFKGHRHDQSVISYLAHADGFEKIPYGYLAYWKDRAQFDSHICNRGLWEP